MALAAPVLGPAQAASVLPARDTPRPYAPRRRCAWRCHPLSNIKLGCCACASPNFPHPDRSIADLWIAQQLLLSGLPAAEVKTILQQGGPGFPRHHATPEDYLHRTLTRARTAIAAAFQCEA